MLYPLKLRMAREIALLLVFIASLSIVSFAHSVIYPLNPTMARDIAVLAVFLASVFLLQSVHSVVLQDDTQDEIPSSFTAQKRGSRRIQRDRYNMGYLFGKRKAISVQDLSTSLTRNEALAFRVARHLDRNADGYVSIGELL
nr:hypothetical protein BaRGS_024594 [Batillaria attramentaria]